jgi:proline dehydrogenase
MICIIEVQGSFIAIFALNFYKVMQQKIAIDFTDTEKAFANRSNSDLKQAELMFKLLNTPVISPIGKSLLKMSVKLHLPVKSLIKATLYKHFVGGENLEDCIPTVKRLASHRVKSILDFSEEGKESEAELDNTYKELLRNIVFGSTHENIPVTVFKMTGIAPADILEKVTSGRKLEADDQKRWERVEQRVESLCNEASKKNIPIMIDAEDSWMQGAIDQLALKMMAKYNKEKVMVINTYQLYRKDRLQFLMSNYRDAEASGYKIGAKLVRGAYMEKERARALEMGYASPIHETKKETDKDYNEAVNFCMDHLENIFLMVASHNENSCRKAAEKMLTLSYPKNYWNLWFSQLLGMCDHISNILAAEGYNVAKYVPYGPVESVTPYLIRRADENSSVAGQARIELSLLKKELARRRRSK